MSVTDYVGRTVDMLAYQGAIPKGDTLLSQTLALPNEGGRICTGIQKLAQRFLLKLLTEKGSMPYRPNEGCEFMTKARLGYYRTSLDVLSAFSASLADIRISFLNEEDATDPDDERFAEAEPINVVLHAGDAYMLIKVTSRAGTDREVIAPLKVTV